MRSTTICEERNGLETTMNAYSHISASEIVEDASDAFDEVDRQN
jgi:hypothetical protein